MFYPGGDSQHTQNIQINMVIGEMKNMYFILWEKLNRPFGQPNILFFHALILLFLPFLYYRLILTYMSKLDQNR